jgi:hypothetical protein
VDLPLDFKLNFFSDNQNQYLFKPKPVGGDVSYNNFRAASLDTTSTYRTGKPPPS